jgi:hypothetical protein
MCCYDFDDVNPTQVRDDVNPTQVRNVRPITCSLFPKEKEEAEV